MVRERQGSAMPLAPVLPPVPPPALPPVPSPVPPPAPPPIAGAAHQRLVALEQSHNVSVDDIVAAVRDDGDGIIARLDEGLKTYERSEVLLRTRGLDTRAAKRALKHAGRHVLRNKSAVDYARRRQQQQHSYERKKDIAVGHLAPYPWLADDPNIQTLAPVKKTLLADLHRGKTPEEVQLLLASALCKRFNDDIEKGKANVSKPELTAADVECAATNSFGRPPLSVMPHWITQSESGVPRLPTASCAQLKALCSVSTCTPSDLGTNIDTTLNDLLVVQSWAFNTKGFLSIRVSPPPTLPLTLFFSCHSRSTIVSKFRYQFDSHSPFLKGAHTATRRSRKDVVGFDIINFDLHDAPHPQGLVELTSPSPQEFLDGTFQAPPSSTLAYIVAEAAPPTLAAILHCGARLSSHQEIKGITTSLVLASGDAKTAAAMHIEDANLCSLNLLLAGDSKIWLIVPPKEKTRLEALIIQRMGLDPYNRKCSQFVRHLSIFLPTSELDSHNIPYEILEQRPGDMVFTAPGAYHQIINRGKNLAVAINYEPVTAPEEPQDYVWCTKQCAGSYCLDRSTFMTKRE